MDKNILKRFAMESRTELMKKVSDKLKILYIDENFNENKRGELVNLVGEKHSLSLSKIEFEHRGRLIDRIKNYSDNDEIDEQGINGVVEEVAYTWFNRIIAIRYMEVNDITPISKDNQSLGFRILSSKDNQVDPEIMKFTNLANPNLDINYDKEKYLNQDDDNKKFNILLIAVCEKLGRVIPDVFDGQTDYIDILIPDNMLNETGFVTKVIREIPEEYWKEQVEIIGWLYQYYNQSEKDRVISAKKQYKKNEIAYATQLFTPDWIVKYMVENSLGKYWIEHGGNKKLIDNWKYYIKGNEDNNQLKVKDINNMTVKEVNETLVSKISKISPTSIKCIDPCSGSGHILVYMFDVLYQIYESEGYSSNDIPELILKNNLYGLDIDDRAGQLSILAVLLKARNYDKDIFNKDVIKNLNIVAIQDSKSLSRIVKGRKDLIEQDNVQDLIDTFKDAKEIGSLLIIEPKDYEKILNKVEENFNPILDNDLLQEVKPLVKEAKILSDKYDIVVTNPPYMNNSVMPNKLKKYVNDYYKDEKKDLFSCFINCAINYIKKNGFTGMMTGNVWMFNSSFEKVRTKILNKKILHSLIYFNKGSFFDEATIDICTFILHKDTNKAFCYKLSSKVNGMKGQEHEFLKRKQENYYIFDENLIRKIPGIPFAFWLSHNFIDLFNNNISIKDICFPRQGLHTGDNDKFLRMWHEVFLNKIDLEDNNIWNTNKKWAKLNKGGSFRKWYGNHEFIINWENNGIKIKNNKKSVGANNQTFFENMIGFTDFTSYKPSFRYYGKGFVYDVSGPSLFNKEDKVSNEYFLGFLNSKIVDEMMSILSPSVHMNQTSLSNIPFIIDKTNYKIIEEKVNKNINISKQDWDSFETSWDFKEHPLLSCANLSPQQVAKGIANAYQPCNTMEEAYNHWQTESEERFNTLKKNEEELNKIFIDIYGLQDELTPEEDDKDVTVRKADRVRDIKSFISYAVGCMFGRYSLDEKGLAYAGGDFDKSKYKTYKVDEDNIIPITDTPYLGDDIVKKFKDFVEVCYGPQTLNKNLNFIAETLGKKEMESDEDTIRRYFLNDFYKDHVKTYQKRPIYWLFESGKRNGFKALIYMHRYNEDTIAKLRIDYLHKIQEAYRHELNDIEQKLNTDVSVEEKRRLTKEQADLTAKLDELKPYEEKIAHLANQRIKIDLDDGVKVNYTKFQDVLAKIK